MAVNLDTAARMIAIARHAGIQLGVISQHRFDDPVLFLKRALDAGRLGRLLQADAYVKWHRTDAYYARPGKGTWEVEGGGALISQAIHQLDLLLHLIGVVDEVSAYVAARRHACHRIGRLRVRTSALCVGATGVIQASTSLWPGYPERIEFTAPTEPPSSPEINSPPGMFATTAASLPLWRRNPLPELRSHGHFPRIHQRQLSDFGAACREARPPACSGEDGYRALQLVRAIYDLLTRWPKVFVSAAR